jgi:hypothetical protein
MFVVDGIDPKSFAFYNDKNCTVSKQSYDAENGFNFS